MSLLQYTAKSHHLQWNVQQLSQICHHFYQAKFQVQISQPVKTL